MGSRVVLRAAEQVVYGPHKTGEVIHANPALVTAWQDGLIVLRNARLDTAVAEINRYRRGMVVIGNDTLRSQRVDTVLRLAQIDKAVALICEASGAHATHMGDYVWLT